MGTTFVWEKLGQSLGTVIFFSSGIRIDKMLLIFLVFYIWITTKNSLALSSSYNPNILLGIASNDAMGFVELAKQFAYNFTFEEFKNQIELKVLYNVILGIIKILYPSQIIGIIFVLIWAHSFI